MTDTDKAVREVWGVTVLLRVVRELGFPAAVTAFLLYQMFVGTKSTEAKLERIVVILDERLPRGNR